MSIITTKDAFNFGWDSFKTSRRFQSSRELITSLGIVNRLELPILYKAYVRGFNMARAGHDIKRKQAT